MKTHLNLSNVNKLFFIDDTFYFQRYDKFYALNETGEKELIVVGDKPICHTQIILNGERVNLFVGDKLAFVAQGENLTVLDWIDAEVLGAHKGRLFSANGRIITFSKRFDFENQSVDLTVDGSLRVEKDSGDVIGFLSDNDTLYVFCERAIYTIFMGAETIDFVFKKIRILQQKIDKNSLVIIDNVAYFISDKKAYKYNKNTLRCIGEFLSNCDCAEIGFASFYDGAYLLPFSKKESEEFKLYVCDCENSTECILDAQSKVSNCGYYFVDGELVRFERGGENLGERKFVSTPIYPTEKGEIDLCEISFFAGETGFLKVKTSLGQENFAIKKGYNSIKKFFFSPWFAFEFTSQNNNFSIKDLSMKYFEKGE